MIKKHSELSSFVSIQFSRSLQNNDSKEKPLRTSYTALKTLSIFFGKKVKFWLN